MSDLSPSTTPPPVSPASATMESFFTRQRANEGVELDMTLPDGTPTEFKLRIRGIDSDAFKEAQAASQRRMGDKQLDGITPEEITKLVLEEKVAVLASLIISWNFPNECTEANKRLFLKEAPQVMDMIDKLAFRRSLFFRKGLKNSTSSPVGSSS